MADPETDARSGLDRVEELLRVVGLKARTKPYAHQAEGLILSGGCEFFAQLGEQGTGKTWILINEAALLWGAKKIDAVLVFAPKGVDANWLNDQIPKHIPEGLSWTGALWRANARKKQRVALGRISNKPIDFQFEPQAKPEREMKWLMMNWESIATQRGFQFAMEFLEANRCMIIADEAHRCKSADSVRSKALLRMRHSAQFRRIATGTPITNSPFDMFMPFTFLSETILETSSFWAFKAEYGKMIGPVDPLYHSITERMKKRLMAKGQSEASAEKMAMRRMPQIQDRDEFERPIYRNLDKLQKKVAAHSFRVLKKDCLDLPEKIYMTRYFELTDEQVKYYVEARDKFRVMLDDTTIQPLTALTALQKLSQITSGFYIETAEKKTHWIPGGTPKKQLLMEILEDFKFGDKVIIWANFRAELEAIKEACEGRSIVEYHGGVSDKDKKDALDRFQNGDADTFIGNPKSGGVGLTLHAASNMIYYSNSYSLETRQQSEDRAHRIGQERHLVIWDLVAENTVEEKIIAALQAKADLAALVNGDLL